jgi:hypothetical protein
MTISICWMTISIHYSPYRYRIYLVTLAATSSAMKKPWCLLIHADTSISPPFYQYLSLYVSHPPHVIPTFLELNVIPCYDVLTWRAWVIT